MKSQILNLILEPSNKRPMLSIGLSVALVNTAIILPINAQDSYLPPEVIPMSQSINYTNTPSPAKAISNLLPENSNLSGSNIPGVVSQINQQQNFQTPQEARQALYNSWANNNISQANNQTSYNETANPMNNFSDQNTSAEQAQNLSPTMAPDLNNQKYTTADGTAPPQTQVLSGTVNTQSTSRPGASGGISHLTGVVSGLAMGAIGLAGMRSAGGAYSAGLYGAGLTNYGVNSGFRF